MITDYWEAFQCIRLCQCSITITETLTSPLTTKSSYHKKDHTENPTTGIKRSTTHSPSRASRPILEQQLQRMTLGPSSTPTEPSTQQIHRFPQFNELPFELRCMVWKFMAATPRTVYPYQVFGAIEPSLLGWDLAARSFHEPVPAMLHVSQEPREEGLKHYTAVHLPRQRAKSSRLRRASFYLNFDVDTLHLPMDARIEMIDFEHFFGTPCLVKPSCNCSVQALEALDLLKHNVQHLSLMFRDWNMLYYYPFLTDSWTTLKTLAFVVPAIPQLDISDVQQHMTCLKSHLQNGTNSLKITLFRISECGETEEI